MNKYVRFIITFFFGAFGVHKFVDKKIGIGILYLLTGGLFGIGWLIDTIKALVEMLKKDDPTSTATTDYVNDTSNLNTPPAQNNDSTVTVNNSHSTDISQKRELNDFIFEGIRYVVKYRYSNVPIVGRQYCENVSNLSYSNTLILDNEPDNEYDNNALKLSVMQNGVEIKIGYMKKDTKLYNMANDFLKRDDCVRVTFDDLDAFTMEMAFYKEEIPEECEEYYALIKKQKPSTTFSLNCKHDDYQCELYDLLIGTPVNFEMDFLSEKDKHIATVGFGAKIGIVPKSKLEFIEGHPDASAFVSKVWKDNEGNYKVQVAIFE